MLKNRFRKYLPVVVDIETGGFDPKKNAILEIAITLIEFENGNIIPGETIRHHIAPFQDSIVEKESLEFTKAELLKRTGLSEEKFKELDAYGILPKRNQSLGEMYNADDLFVTQIVSRFYSYGIEPRHLRHIKRGADAEALLIDQRLTGLQGKRAIKAIVELARLSSELKTLLLRRALHGNTGIS